MLPNRALANNLSTPMRSSAVEGEEREEPGIRRWSPVSRSRSVAKALRNLPARGKRNVSLRGEKEQGDNTSSACRRRPRVACDRGRFFSRARRRSVSPSGEKDRGD
ncbi:hypothetical protein BHM03_00023124, partial [Ensete ventricosum]